MLVACLTAASGRGDPPGSPPLQAQTLARKATTAAALVAYPTFFHGQAVRVRGELRRDVEEARLASGSASLALLTRPGAAGPRWAGQDARAVEVVGVFWDVGRLDADDPHLSAPEVQRISARRLGRDWPAIGELPAIVVDTVAATDVPPAPSIRSIALEPERYLDQRVTVRGQFRGRNLYGDLPDSPGKSRWDFVLRSADAAIWITGLRPRRRGFSLDPNARVDTGHWLEATGIVRAGRAIVWLEAIELALAKAVEEAAQEPAPRPQPGPPPEVIFSAPTQDETDVARDASVRIQFSRDMDRQSFSDQVRAAYLSTPSTEPGGPRPPPIEFTYTYNTGSRYLEIRFARPLERFRTLKIELLGGVAAADGVPLKPWTLTFSLGG